MRAAGVAVLAVAGMWSMACSGSEPTPVSSATITSGPPPVATSLGTVALVASTPALGGTVQSQPLPCPEDRDSICVDPSFQLQIQVTATVPLGGVRIYADLLDARGNICGESGNVPVLNLDAGGETKVMLNAFILTDTSGCHLFQSGPSGATSQVAVWLDRVKAVMPASFTFVAPALAPPTAPRVTNLCWHATDFPSGGWCGDSGLPGERVEYHCVIDDPDGDALTATLSYASNAGCSTADDCWASTVTLPPRFTPLPVEVRVGGKTSNGSGFTLTCRVLDAHGLEVVTSACPGCR